MRWSTSWLTKAHITNLTPIGLYTLALQAANFLNSMPLATRKRNGCTVSSKLITPTCFLLGRQSNFRAPGDIPDILEDPGRMIENLQRAAQGMREYFCVNIPDLLLRTCWLDGPKLAIKVGVKHEHARVKLNPPNRQTITAQDYPYQDSGRL